MSTPPTSDPAERRVRSFALVASTAILAVLAAGCTTSGTAVGDATTVLPAAPVVSPSAPVAKIASTVEPASSTAPTAPASPLVVSASSVSSAPTVPTSAPTTTASTPSSTVQSSGAPTTSTAAAPRSSTKAAGVDLSGRWTGKYDGAFTGTFVLKWTQGGSTLSGTIELSAPPDTESLTGTVTGSTISFGTVGSTAVTYSGTIAGNSMSGTYKVNGAPSGDWQATKSG